MSRYLVIVPKTQRSLATQLCHFTQGGEGLLVMIKTVSVYSLTSELSVDSTLWKYFGVNVE